MQRIWMGVGFILLFCAGCSVNGFVIHSSLTGSSPVKTTEVAFETTPVHDVATGRELETETMMHTDAILEEADGGFLVLGDHSQKRTYLGAKDLFLTKFDAAGKVVWAKRHVARLKGASLAPYAAIRTTDGGVAACGYGGTWKAHVAMVMKLDASGNEQWTHVLKQGTCLAIEETDEGHLVYLSSNKKANLLVTIPNKEGLLKVVPLAIKPFDHRYQLSDVKLVKLPNGDGYVMAATTRTDMGYEKDLLLLKLTKTLDVAWKKTYDFAKFDIIPSLHLLADNHVLLAATRRKGGSGDRVVLLKVDLGGTLKWQKTFENIEMAKIQATANGFILAGMLGKSSGKDNDVIVISTNETDEVQWISRMGGPTGEYPEVIKQLKDGSILLASGRKTASGDYPKVVLFKLDAATGKSAW